MTVFPRLNSRPHRPPGSRRGVTLSARGLGYPGTGLSWPGLEADATFPLRPRGASFGFNPAQAAALMEHLSVRLDLGHKGDWIVDPRELALRLGVSMAVLKRQERLGQVEARIKPGIGANADQTRVTIRLHDKGWDKGWRGTFDRSGALIAEERF